MKSGRFNGLECVTSHFGKTVLKTWIDSNGDVPNESPSTALWNNKYVVYNGRVLFFKTWISRGITSVNDIVSDQGFCS